MNSDSVERVMWESGGIWYDNSGPNGAPNPIGFVESEVHDRPSALPLLPSWRHRRFFTIEQLGEPTPIEWLVEGWIPAGELSMIYGPGDSYKSFLALHWGLEAARDSTVVYIAGEGAHGLRTRVPAWLRHHNEPQAWHAGFRVDELPVQLDSQSEREAWRAEVEDEFEGEAPDWVIVDTLSMNFSGDENSPQDMNGFVKGLEQIRRARAERTALTIIHHTPVGQESRERGTAALRNATAATVRMSRRSGTGFSVLVENDRQKEAGKHHPVRMTLVKEEWENKAGDPVDSLAVASFKEARDEVISRDSKKKVK